MAAAQRLTDPKRTSPAANTPGRLVSSGSGSLGSDWPAGDITAGHQVPGRVGDQPDPRTDGAAGIGLVTNTAGYLVTGSDAARESGSDWPLPRQPLPLETSRPGVFAAGDVRFGSIKRCAAAIGEGSMAVALVHRRLAEVGGG